MDLVTTQPVTYALTAVCILITMLTARGCEVSLQSLGRFQPVLLGRRGAEGEYMPRYPSVDDKVQYVEGESVVLLCPGVNNTLHVEGRHGEEVQWIRAECRDGRLLTDALTQLPFHHVHCRLPPAGSVRSTGTPCSGDSNQTSHVIVQVVFQFGEHHVPLIDVCFDRISEAPLYASYKLAKEIGRRRTAVDAPSARWWGGAGLYSYDVSAAYSLQWDTIAAILGDEELARRYVSGALPPPDQETLVDNPSLRRKCLDPAGGRSLCYLAEGHLAGEGDFVYVAQQFATFFHVNSAPRWRSLGCRNWERVAEVARRYATTRQADLEVRVGALGVARLEDRELYLHLDDGGEGKTPVPQQFWKMVVDRARHCGLVVLVLNNPYLSAEQAASSRLNCSTEQGAGFFLGDDVPWGDVDEGYTYTCTVEGFLQLLPQLYVPGSVGMEPLALIPAD